MHLDDIIRATLEAARQRFPKSPRVVDIDFHRGEDSTGDQAVWIYVVLDDATPAVDLHHVRVQPIAEAIRSELRKPLRVGAATYPLDLVPYVLFMTESERRAVKAGQ